MAGLAREVEALRRQLGPLDGLGGRVDELAGVVSELAVKVAALTARKGPTPAPSWLMAPADDIVVAEVLDELFRWLFAIFLRYGDGAAVVPECWLYHPDIVEELLWLMHAWCAAYQGPAASVGLAADWHDRHRPGVVRRIRGYAPSCSLEQHQSRPEWNQAPKAATAVPGMNLLDRMTTWWAFDRDRPAPEPEVRIPDWEKAT